MFTSVMLDVLRMKSSMYIRTLRCGFHDHVSHTHFSAGLAANQTPMGTVQQLYSSLLGTGVEDGGSSLTVTLVFATFVAVCGSFAFGSTLGYSSPAETGIMDDLGLSVAEFSLFGSIMSIGAMLGAVTSGKIADLVGRRWVMAISEIASILGWVLIMFSKAGWILDLGRLLNGCAIGLISYVVPVYIAEITPKNLRGGFTTIHTFMLTFGSAVTFTVGTVVSWRILALIEIIPCLLQLFGLLIIPESPRWLVKVGKEKESEGSLRRLRGANADISDEIREYIDTLQQIPQVGVLDLFQRIYAPSLIVAIGLMLLQQFDGCNAVVTYASSIFDQAGFSSTIGTITMAVLQMAMLVTVSVTLDKFGRRPLLMISAAGACLGSLFVALSFSFKDLVHLKEVSPAMAFVGILVFAASFGLGLAGIPWLIMSEIFPLNMKGSAGSLVSLVNWFGSFAVTYLFNFSMEWSSAGTFFILAGFSALTIAFVAKLVPETKARTLEEIQASMNPLTTVR